MKSDSIFNGMGHIGEVLNEMHDFAMAAMTPGVKTICEVGFNAGHSAGVFLLSNPSAKLISFDLGTLAWTKSQVEYLKHLFPNRLTFVEGNSQVAIKEYAAKNPEIKCDLWCSLYVFSWRSGDMATYVLADDYTANFPAVKEIWHKWDYERRIRTIFCAIDEGKYSGYEKGWCLGRFTQALSSEVRTNFKGAECVPAGPYEASSSPSQPSPVR
eukprot:gene32355-43223_t